MSDETTNSGAAPEPGGTTEARPQYRLVTQYVKDLSFESPRPPAQLPHTMANPRIQVTVNVNARALNTESTVFETELSIEAKATKDEEVVFIAELLYAAVVELINVPDELKQPLTMIEGPRIIFPFARRILADLVRDGGFPPLLMEPIDFAALYQRHASQQAQPAENAPATEPESDKN